MNGNRGQYTSAPLYNMKNKQRKSAAAETGEQRPRRFGALGLTVTLVLPVLFLVALVVPVNIIRWIFLGAVVVSVALMWILGAFVRNARSTLTIVYAALAVVIGLALFMNSQAPEVQRTSANVQQQDALFSENNADALAALLNGNVTPAPTVNANSETISAAKKQMIQFLEYWSINSVPGMLSLCTPSWVAKYEEPETELFQLISGARPESYEFESISGSDGDTSRTATLKVMLNANNGTPATMNRLQVLLFRVNGTWYIDPQSLKGTPIDTAAEAAQQNRQIISSTIVPTATPDPQAEANRFYVYYNKEANGSYYHAEHICDAVSQSYWPLTALDFSLINSQQFKKLQPCEVCNPPARPNAF